MTVHIFTYGTLMIPDVMQAVTYQNFRASDAQLPGYEQFCLVGKVYPGMIKTGQSYTTGKVYFDVDVISLQRLDYFEDDIYTRQSVDLVLPDLSNIHADAYIVPSAQTNLVSSQPWSEADFRATHLDAFLLRIKGWMSEYCDLIQPL